MKSQNVYDYLGFEVWIQDKTFDGCEYSKCVAAFYYWQECLEYKDYAFKRGVERVVLRTLQVTDTWRGEVREVTNANH